MRIAVVVSTFPPYQGGMGNMARAYALGLSRLGHEVEVFCPAGGSRGEELSGPYRVQRLKAWAGSGTALFSPSYSPGWKASTSSICIIRSTAGWNPSF